MSSLNMNPLLPIAATHSAPTAQTFTLPIPAHREWKGHLFACFGSFDQLGLVSFAYVCLLRPFAWGGLWWSLLCLKAVLAGVCGINSKEKLSAEDQKACTSVGLIAVLLSLATYALFICGLLYACKARTAMRIKYGIPGSIYEDAAAWLFCGPCAQCQETRTLAHNNVEKGVWYGETVLEMPDAQELSLSAHQPPPAPLIV